VLYFACAKRKNREGVKTSERLFSILAKKSSVNLITSRNGSASRQMLEDDLAEHLVCPDCRQKITLAAKNRLVCIGCKRVFNLEDNFVQMLPTEIKRNYEDEAWKTLPWEGADKPVWMSLLHKKYRILYFHEKILPNTDFTGKVLEIGAGTSWASAMIKKRYPSNLVVASDVSPFALEKGLSVARLLHSNINYRIACDAERLPFSDAYFDVVLSNSTIHHFSNPQKGICEMWRVLRKGGKCCALGEVASGVLFKSILTSRVGPAGRRSRNLKIKERLYSLTEWKHFFAVCGFKTVRINFDKTWQHKLYDFSVAAYYRFLSNAPDSIIGNFLPCNIDVFAKKT